MDQINAGILKLMNIPGSAHVNGNMADFGAKREPVFDVLLEQKSNQARTEVVSDKGRKPEDTEKIPTKETETEKKAPSTEETEEETCDVAREAAAAQIVWVMAPNAEELRVEEQLENVATIEQPMIIITNDEPAPEFTGNMLDQPVGTGSVVQENVVNDASAAEGFELTAEQTEQNTETVFGPKTETRDPLSSDRLIEMDETDIKSGKKDSNEPFGEFEYTERPLFKLADSIPVKVSEIPRKVEQFLKLDQQITGKLNTMLQNGDTKMELRLQPAQLGSVTVELIQTEEGALNIVFNAENDQTRIMLIRTIGNLQEMFAERGQQNVQITVDQSNESQRQDNNANQNNDLQDGSNGRQNEQQRRDDHRSGEDFLQQLRLGMIPIEEEDEET